MNKKPKLSFWQIWNLSFGFLGVQIGYSLQNSNTSTIFESLGADVSHLSYFWLAAPLAGMVIQPIIGMFSDGTWTRFGRRIPYILGGALISTIALMLMPNCPTLWALAPLAMGAFILLFMDLSFNVTMQPFRALVADMLDDSQKTEGYVVQTFLINIGAVIGAILPLIMTWAGVSDEAVPGQVSPHIAWSYYIGGAILLATVLVTAFKTKEYPPKEFAEYNGLAEVNDDEAAEKTSFLTLLKNTPTAMIKLGITQFFSWAALFIMWTYLKPAITGSVTDGGVILSEGATQTWVGVLNGVYPIPACIAAIFMTKLAERFGNKSVYLEAAATYDRTFNRKHAVSGLLLFNRRNYDNGGKLPYRNQGLAGRASYTYANRYVAEFNFGYNGAENFAHFRGTVHGRCQARPFKVEAACVIRTDR